MVKLVVAMAIVCAATVARAQPSMTPPTPEPTPTLAESRTEVGVHVGIATSDFDRDDNDAAGLGPSIDFELGWRHRWLSLIAYGDFTNSSSASGASSSGTDDIHTRYLGLGCRVRFHLLGAFIGSGMGVESVHQNGPGLETLDNTVPVFEVDAGYTFPKIGGVQPQILGVLQGAPFEDVALAIARLSIGLVF